MKVAEYLDAGTSLVVVLDDDSRQVHLFRPDGVSTLGVDDELTVPDLLPGFLVPVRRFFE